MKRTVLQLGMLCGLVLGFPTTVPPQTVKIIVQKNLVKISSPGRSSSYYPFPTDTEIVSYTIEVRNSSTSDLRDIKIQWAILVRDSFGHNNLVEGLQQVRIPFGGKFAFETDTMELRVSNYQDYYYGASIIGHAVQVFAGEKLLGQECVPSNILPQIEAIRNKENGKMHHF